MARTLNLRLVHVAILTGLACIAIVLAHSFSSGALLLQAGDSDWQNDEDHVRPAIRLRLLSEQPNGEVDAVNTAISNTKRSFEIVTRNNQDFIINDERNGMIPSATLLPSSGRLLITNNDISPAQTSCSGVLIAPTKFLTAAHCVCGFLPNQWLNMDATSCNKALSKLKLQIFLPTAGLFTVFSEPIVHPDYRSSQNTQGFQRRVTSLADLAIVSLAEPAPIPPALIGKVAKTSKPVLASFGQSQFRTLPASVGLPVDSLFHTGLKQVSKLRPPLLRADSCGKSAAADTFCIEYSDLPAEGEGADAGVCGGDSGGPLYDASDGSFRLIGVASRYSDSSNDCQTYRYSHFIDIDKYKEWLGAHASNVKIFDTYCEEAILSGGGYHLISTDATLLLATAFDNVLNGFSRPKLKIDSQRGGFDCEQGQPNQGVLACKIISETSLQLYVSSGFAQTVICKRL